ncbi:helix-turn-helix domain-containing protein [uncultured Desulfobacter sp.]|uniref:winged helix-turn-helix domain-containing protein n=1 Tax=uncultured Desulfobacter sp. TaxID=240139 RepID=UPI002AABB497|nr:helix-turn-helix domain-containing protein [uncultured Desulfobacter sp.]
MRITIDIEFSEETTQLFHATIKKVQNLIPGKAFNISTHEPPENTLTPEETTDKGNDVEAVSSVPKSKKPRKIKKDFRQNILKLINQNEGLSPQEIQTMTGLTGKQVSNVVSLLKRNGVVDRVKGKYYQKPEPEIEFEIEVEKQAAQGENVAPKS